MLKVARDGYVVLSASPKKVHGNGRLASSRSSASKKTKVVEQPKESPSYFTRFLLRLIRSGLFKTKESKQQASYNAGLENLVDRFNRINIPAKIVTITDPKNPSSKLKIIVAKQETEKEMDLFIPGQYGRCTEFEYEAIRSWVEGKSFALTTYRGYYDNPGKPTQAGVAEDLAKVIDELKKINYQPENTNIVASSMGCEVLANSFAHKATSTGLHYSAPTFKSMELRAPFKNLLAMTKLKLRTDKKYAHLKPYSDTLLKLVEPYLINSFTNLEHLKAKEIMVIAGTHDATTPFEQSYEVFRKLKSQYKPVKLVKLLSKNLTHQAICHPSKSYKSMLSDQAI